MDERVMHHVRRLTKVQERKQRAERLKAYYDAPGADLWALNMMSDTKQIPSTQNLRSKSKLEEEACKVEEASKPDEQHRKEEARMRAQEGQQKGEESHIRQAERRKEEEARMREQEEQRKEEESRIREEERRKEEEARMREQEEQRREEESRIREEARMREQEEQRKEEAHMREQEEQWKEGEYRGSAKEAHWDQCSEKSQAGASRNEWRTRREERLMSQSRPYPDAEQRDKAKNVPVVFSSFLTPFSYKNCRQRHIIDIQYDGKNYGILQGFLHRFSVSGLLVTFHGRSIRRLRILWIFPKKKSKNSFRVRPLLDPMVWRLGPRLSNRSCCGGIQTNLIPLSCCLYMKTNCNQ